MKPLCVDLFCGLGGWAEAFIAEGYDVVGFDIDPSFGPVYPGEFRAEDVRFVARHIHESKHRFGLSRACNDDVVVVASPPCEEFSRWDQPWKNVIKNRREPDLSLWRAAESIAREIGCPIVIENVRGAQQFMGVAHSHFGKQYLWGDVPAILPKINGLQNEGRQKQSLSSTRRAERAKIPFPLAQHIARVFKPSSAETPVQRENHKVEVHA